MKEMDIIDYLLAKKKGSGSQVTVEALSVTENGTYSEAGKAYSPVTVAVPLPTNANERKSVTSYPVTDSANYPLPKCDVTVTDADKCEVIVTTDNTITEDSGVYIERQSGGGNRELDEIVGGSVVWNQLAQNVESEYGGGPSAAFSYDETTRTGTINATSTDARLFRRGETVVNHVYRFIGTATTTVAGTLTIQVSRGWASKNISIAANTSTRFDVIIKPTSASEDLTNHTPNIYMPWVNEYVLNVKDLQIFDLTAVFGSTIADYIYTLEQATAGSGIAWLRSYGYLTEDYYGYTANKIESVSVARHVMKDSNDSVIGSYAINPITLRGIPKLNASNQLYYDGDIYEASGRVTRKYGVVDLGTLTWSHASSNRSISNAIANTIKKPATQTSLANLLTSNIYTQVSSRTSLDTNGQFAILQDGEMIFYYDGVNEPKGYMVYEKATPTYEDSSPFEPNQIVDANGTEEYIDAGVEAGTRDVAIPVGHDTKYYNGKAYVKPLTAGTSDTVSMADMGIMPTSPMYISANGSVDVEYWKSNQ